MNYKILLLMLFLFSVVSGGITFVDSELRKDRIISLKNDLDDKHLKQILNELKNIIDLDNLLHIKSQLEQITLSTPFILLVNGPILLS